MKKIIARDTKGNRIRLHLGVLLAIACAGLVAFSVPRTDLPEIIAVQIPAAAEPSGEAHDASATLLDRYVDGARIVRISAGGGPPVNLTPEFAAASDPDVSFDASTIIFSGKRRAGDPWQLWRMNADGSGKEQITSGPGDHITPVHAGSRFYLNDPAPTPQIIFASSQHGWRNRRDGSPTFSLYATDHRGETVRRLTFNLYSDLSPDVLPTGRVVYTSWQHFGDRSGGRDLLTLSAVNIDGTDFYPYHGHHDAPRFKHMAHISNSDDRVYFVESDTPTWLGGGQLAFVSSRRPLYYHQRLTTDERGWYHSPCPLPENDLIASYRSAAPGAVYELYRIDPASGERLAAVFGQKSWHTIDAQPLLPHPEPDGKSNWLVPGAENGVLYCLASHRTNLERFEPLPKGEIRYVRVVEGLPGEEEGATDEDGFGRRRLLGTAPVEADGSFHIRVPAETPVTFQLLDEDYVARRSQKAWTWVMGNENRGCIGCHEDWELSPPNQMVDAVIKPAVDLTLPPSRRRMVDFQNEIAPIIASRCATSSCHGPGEQSPDFSEVSGGEARNVYEALTGPIATRPDERLVVPGKAGDSPLIWLLFGRRLGSDSIRYTRDVEGMPGHDALSAPERIQMIEWIDLGAQWNVRSSDADGGSAGGR